jgi:hypothetical protein
MDFAALEASPTPAPPGTEVAKSHPVARLAVTSAVVALLSLVAGCEASLDESLDGKPCDSLGHCVAGYSCNADDVCVLAGTDEPAPVACKTGETACGKTCVVLATNPANCGACGTTCAAPAGMTAVCIKGSCETKCPSNLPTCLPSVPTPTPTPKPPATPATPTCKPAETLCDKLCVDLENDPKHCGACSNECEKGGCKAGKCEKEEEEEP